MSKKQQPEKTYSITPADLNIKFDLLKAVIQKETAPRNIKSLPTVIAGAVPADFNLYIYTNDELQTIASSEFITLLNARINNIDLSTFALKTDLTEGLALKEPVIIGAEKAALDSGVTADKITAYDFAISDLNGGKYAAAIDLTNSVSALSASITGLQSSKQDSFDLAALQKAVADNTNNYNGLYNDVSSLMGASATKAELSTALALKQDTISDLSVIRTGAAAGATALQSVPDNYITQLKLEAYHDSAKQDAIADLDTIRSGAAKGATAIQSLEAAAKSTVVWSGSQKVDADGLNFAALPGFTTLNIDDFAELQVTLFFDGQWSNNGFVLSLDTAALSGNALSFPVMMVGDDGKYIKGYGVKVTKDGTNKNRLYFVGADGTTTYTSWYVTKVKGVY
jgi:hypothetical protein